MHILVCNAAMFFFKWQKARAAWPFGHPHWRVYGESIMNVKWSHNAKLRTLLQCTTYYHSNNTMMSDDRRTLACNNCPDIWMFISKTFQLFFNGRTLCTILRQDCNFVWIDMPVNKFQKYTHLNTTTFFNAGQSTAGVNSASTGHKYIKC